MQFHKLRTPHCWRICGSPAPLQKKPLTSVWAVGNALLCAGVRGLNLLLVLNGCVMGDWNVLFLLKSSKSEVSLFP